MAKYEDILEEIRKRTQLANTELNNVQDAINYGQSNGRSYESLDIQLKNSRAITRDYAANLKRIADRNNIAYSNTEELTPTLSSLASKNINKKAWEQDSKLPTNIVDIAKRNEQDLQNEQKRFNETIGNTPEYKDYLYRTNKLNPTLRYARDVAELNEKGVSGLDKVFSPLISGLDNIKTSGTFKQDNNSRVMLPTLNDLKTQKATENANWLYKGYADISQSIGNMLPGIAASAINPALGSTLFFGNTYQNAKNQALLEGYDESSASNYGIINATLELGVGKVLGGTTALLGKSPVSKLLGDKITSKLIVNPAINSAISDMMSEFGEEYIQEWLDPKVKAYILDKKDLAEAWESSKFFDKQNFYAGLLGALSAGITNTPGTIRQNSALNSEFEKIVDTLQKDGNEKLTNEQLKQLKKTYYKEYNKALKNNTEIDYENISNKLTKENRTEQSLTNDIEQLKEQQKQTTDNKLKQELATRISGLEQELNQFKLPMASTEGMNLMESASKYDIKPETQSAVQQLMENRGIESRWDATKFSDNSVNALWSKDANGNRSVIFNPNASLDTIVEEVAVHELTHDILSSENTTLNAQEVLDYVSQLDGYNEARQSLENTYSTMYDPNSAEFNSLIDEEVVADVLGRKLGNQEFINQLVNSKPSIAKSIYNWVISKLNSIVNKGKVRSEKLYWQNIKNNFENAYKQEYKNNEMASTKYKVSDSATIQERYNAIKNQRDDLRTQLYELRQQRNDIINTIPDYSMFKQYDELTEINKSLDENKQKSIELYEEQKQLEKQLEKVKEKEKQAQIKEINKKSTPFKEKQFEIIKKYNPMLDDYHTGIRQPGEIRTWEEAMYDAEKDGEGYSWGDFTKEDAEKALKNKTITIYSSYPIKNGVFVTPSRIQAEQYAGGEGSRVYSKTVRPDRVAWINVDEGQYADAGINTYETKYSKENAEWDKFLDKNIIKDNQGRELSKQQQEFFKDSKVRDDDGRLQPVYHMTNADFNKIDFNKNYQGVFWFASSKQDLQDGTVSAVGTRDKTNSKIMELYANITNPAGWREYDNYGIGQLKEMGYDGVILKEDDGSFVGFVFNDSNQIKNVDNTTPTTNDDIRYSTQSEKWDKWNNKTIAPEGTKTKLEDIKLPKSEVKLPKVETKVETKQETRQEVKLPTRETITKEELEELDSLKALNEITDLSREEQNRLDYLEKKQQGYTERYPGLKKVTDFKEISREYGKYRDLDNFDRTLLRDAESMIKGYRNTERRTKDEWLSIARYIGSNFKGNSEELQKYAIQSWFAASPNQKGSLNRQGKGFVDFKIQEWINSMYDGARVGELDKPSTPKKQTILPMAREDNVLKVNANEIADFMNGINGNQRGWAKTATESDVLKDKVLIKDLDASKLNYVVESNQKSVDTANNHLNTYGYEKSLEDVKSLLRSDKLPKASDVALAERVLQEAVKNGDTKTAQDLIMDIAILGTDLGQATQALSIIKRLTPEGQLSMYTKMIQRAKSRGEKSFENVEITPEMVEMVLNAYKSDGTYDQEDLNNRVENFKQEIANQMKTTTGEKINAWRYLAMLGNPKTHIRNIVSNVAMNGTIKVKNAMARTLESVLPIANRTKTWKKASNFIKNYAETTANEMKGIITGENKYNEKSSLESKKRTFKSDTLEKISNFNSNALEAEDWFFSKRAFKSNLEEYLTANGINTQEDIESRPEVVEKAKNYAKEQAEIATFRQYSKLAAQINNLEKNNKLARFFIEATVPFKKTPINVAKAGVKYSPLGLIKSLSYDIYQVKQGNMEASQLIDNISQGLTGTSLAILGYALAKNGILNGGGDDDKEGKYDTQLGDNQYSLKIGDKSYSISWLSPVAMPLLVGANAFEQLEEKEEWDMNVVSETLAKTLDPLNEMSFMQGLTNALSSYDKGVEKLAGIGESVAQNYVGQFFPTLFSQFASTIDDKKRSTKASANSTYKFGEQTLRSIMYKLPGLRQQLEVATDVWGNEKEQADNIIQRAYESFLAPYSTTKNITSDLDKEIKSIYNKTNETGVIPSVPYSYIKYKDETYRMSANEYTKYKKTFGQNANKYLNNLISSNAYKNASDDDKAKMIKNTYDYAKAEANEEYFKSQSIDYTSDTLKELNALKKIGINDKSLSEYISNKTLASTIKSNSQLSANEKHQKIADNLIKSNLNDKQLAYLYGKYYSTDDKLNNLVELNIPIKEFIKLNSQDIESDYNERTGKTISNSKKNKVINYVNSLNLSIPQKAILIKSQYNTYKNYDNQIVNYVNNLNKSVNDKKVILKSIGFDNYDNDVINYINSQNMSIKDKEKKLKSLGFTIRDGRVYK